MTPARLLLLCLAVALGGCARPPSALNPSGAQPVPPLERVAEKIEAGETIKIVFYGDSISEVGRSPRWHGGASAPGRHWGALLRDRLAEAYPGASFEIDHFAIGGQNAYEGLGRLDGLWPMQPDLVLVAFGTNDLWHHELAPRHTARALGELVGKIKPRADLVLVSTAGNSPADDRFEHTGPTVAATRRVAAEHHVPFVNMRRAIMEATGGGTAWADYHLGPANAHPNDRGHVVWARAAYGVIAAAACAEGPGAGSKTPQARTPATATARSKAAPSREAPGGAVVRMHRGRPTVFVDGEPMPLVAYSPATLEKSFRAATPRFARHAMTAYFLNLPRAEPKEDQDWSANPFWSGDSIEAAYQLPLRTPSFGEQVELIDRGAPEAHLIVRFGLMEPASWRKLHPDQMFVTEEGERLDIPSMASQAWWDASAEYVRAVVRFCEAQPWSGRVIGYANFMRHEGSHEALMKGWLFDHSEVMQRRFRAFLRDKYGTDAALKAAWHDEAVTLESARVPRDRLRGSVPEVSQSLYWQPAAANQPMRDYLLLQRDLFHQGLRQIAEAQQSATRRERFFVFDALKQHMLGWNNHAFFDPGFSRPLVYHDMMAGAGHMNVAPLLDAPGVDGLITPHDYQARGVGGVFLPEGIADSAVLRGDLFLAEMDTRSYTGVSGRRFFAAEDDAAFAAITWRNLATALTHGYTAYAMDVFTDWFGNDRLHEIIGRQVRLMHEAVDWPHETVPGIAMIIDDSAVLETNGDGRYHRLAVMDQPKLGLARCGVPFRIYTFEDLARHDFPDHRVFYFPNLFKVTGERLALLREKVLRDGRLVLWGPGSGISDGQTIDAAHAERLTGFAFDMVRANARRHVIVTDFDHPITRTAGADTIFGDSLAYGPVLLPNLERGGGRELGRVWTKQGLRYPGLAVKRLAGGAGAQDAAWTSVFTAALPLPAELWRGLARAAGAHIYTDSNDVLLADTSVVALHTIKPGEKTIRLPAPASVTDAVTGELLAERTDVIHFQAEAPSTHVYRISSPDR